MPSGNSTIIHSDGSQLPTKAYIAILVVVPLSLFFILCLLFNYLRRTRRKRKSHDSQLPTKAYIAILVVVPLSLFFILCLLFNYLRRTRRKRKSRESRCVRHHWGELYQLEGGNGDPTKAPTIVEIKPRRVSVMTAYSQNRLSMILADDPIAEHGATGGAPQEFDGGSTSTAEFVYERSEVSSVSEYDATDSCGQLVLDDSQPPTPPDTHDTLFVVEKQGPDDTGARPLGQGEITDSWLTTTYL